MKGYKLKAGINWWLGDRDITVEDRAVAQKLLRHRKRLQATPVANRREVLRKIRFALKNLANKLDGEAHWCVASILHELEVGLLEEELVKQKVELGQQLAVTKRQVQELRQKLKQRLNGKTEFNPL